MKILVTGGAGFIASHFLRHMVKKYPDHHFINYDILTYAGDFDRVKDLEDKPNYEFVKGDICDFNFLNHVLRDVDYLFHFAAESHVDNSIGDSLRFTQTNTFGTHVLLETARANKVKKFFHISTDEVYGEILEGYLDETAPLNPSNPYSASKAAAEMIINGYFNTYKMPIIMTRCNNVYGPYQYPEKIIPRFITDLIEGKKVPLHGDGSNLRTYIHVLDFCSALDLIFQNGKEGEIYNIGTKNEISNLNLTKKILKNMNKDESFIEFIKDRPFNDVRYGVDTTKLNNLGWKPKIEFEEGLVKTLEWYKENTKWWSKFQKISLVANKD